MSNFQQASIHYRNLKIGSLNGLTPCSYQRRHAAASKAEACCPQARIMPTKARGHRAPPRDACEDYACDQTNVGGWKTGCHSWVFRPLAAVNELRSNTPRSNWST